MPRLIDYGVRFELAREAVLAVVLRHGPTALSMGSVAAEMAVSVATMRRFLANSAALPQLGLQLIERRRRVRRLTGGGVGLLRDPSPRSLEQALLLELPLTAERVEEERAFQALVHGFPGEQTDHFVTTQDDARLWLGQAVLNGFGLTGEHVPDAEHVRLAALVEGLSAYLLVGRVTPDVACEVVSRHLGELQAMAGRPAEDVT